MEINIDDKKLEEEIIKETAMLLTAGKTSLLWETKYHVDEIAKKIIFESPEIRKIIEEKLENA